MEHIATGNAIREQGLLPSGHTEMRVAGSGAEQFPKVAHVGVFGWAILLPRTSPVAAMHVKAPRRHLHTLARRFLQLPVPSCNSTPLARTIEATMKRLISGFGITHASHAKKHKK